MKPLASLLVVLAFGPAVARPKLRPEHLEPVRAISAPSSAPMKPAARVAARAPDPHEELPPQVVRRPADHVARGTKLYLAGSFKAAITAYRQALAIDAGYAPAHRALGIAYQRMGLVALAIASLRKYLALAPDASDAASVEGRIARMGGAR